jgi:ribosomal-protein-alanine N-acetyltransferase
MRAPFIKIETTRLRLRKFTLNDAPFVLGLLNDPSFINNIADRNIRSLEETYGYIQSKILSSYDKNEFGLLLVELKNDHTPIGMCGLIRRDTLDDVDIGFAFLPAYWSKGYAIESALCVKNLAKDLYQLKRLVGITKKKNIASIKTLEKLGMKFEKTLRLPGESVDVELYGMNLLTDVIDAAK